MTQIILPDAAASKLVGLNGPASICNSSGQVLGTFIPEIVHDPELYARNPSPLSDEERERRRKEGGGRPLSEFWAEMRQKYSDEFK